MKSTIIALAILLGVLVSLAPTQATMATEQRELNWRSLYTCTV